MKMLDASGKDDKLLYMYVTIGILIFAQQEKPWYPLLGEEGEWKFIHDVPEEERVRSVKPPATKDECEVLLLVGEWHTYWCFCFTR